MQATVLARDHLLRAVGDPVEALRGIGPDHAEFGAALIIRAAAGVLAKSPDGLPVIAQAIRDAEEIALPPECRAHLAAAQAWLSGNPTAAAQRYTFILDVWPRDLLALRLAQSCHFFIGWHERFVPVVDRVLTSWTRDRDDFGFALTMAAFAYAESGEAGYAEVLGRRALSIDPACPVGVHAVAHAMAESGQYREGAQWMRDQRAHWTGESRMRTHNAWHLAMFDIDDGNVASALQILDTWLLPASARSPLDACDATALLWRLTAECADSQKRWDNLSDAFERTVTPGFWPYVDLHAGLAHLAAGNTARTRRLAQAIEHCAQGTDFAAMRARQITRPGLRALVAWSDGRRNDAASLLADLYPSLSSAGGSRLQLEIFRRITAELLQWQPPRRHERSHPSLPLLRAIPLAGAGCVPLQS